MLKQYSLVCQAPGNEPYIICAYSGTDLSKVIGISQAKSMPENTYGWIQLNGNGYVAVSGETQSAFVDFRPNEIKLEMSGKWPKNTEKKTEGVLANKTDGNSIAHNKDLRLSQLPPLLIESGPYCNLLREARDVFVEGYFYACVAMCGISFERFQRDKAKPHGATKKHKIWKIRNLLENKKILSSESLRLCKQMAEMRNVYAHGHGEDPKEDAYKALDWMHSFIDKETNLMRDYVIVDGILTRKLTTN